MLLVGWQSEWLGWCKAATTTLPHMQVVYDSMPLHPQWLKDTKVGMDHEGRLWPVV
jgi:hypothetical protein